jgi:hypothetical protein
MGCYLLLEKVWIHGEVGVANYRPCRWAWRKMLLAMTEAQQFEDTVEGTQRQACPEIWERLCSNSHDARFYYTILDSYTLCRTQRTKKTKKKVTVFQLFGDAGYMPTCQPLQY